MAEETAHTKTVVTVLQADELKHDDPTTTVNKAETLKENLSTKLSNIPVVSSSLQTVTKTCNTIKESNSYVGYGMNVAESSLEKAFKAGKAVLDSRTLAPITNSAMENIRYLDKEAGVMVDKFLKSTDNQGDEVQANGAVEELLTKATESGSLAVPNESMILYLGRKLFQVTSFLVFLPYLGPKFALTTILGLFQGSAIQAGRKRKERGSLSEEVKYMEPSPVKRKYGDRQSTSSEEGTLVEITRDYVSEDDSNYVPEEHESEESSEESGDEENREEKVKECLALTEELEEMGIPLSATSKKQVEKMKHEVQEIEASKLPPAALGETKEGEPSSTLDRKQTSKQTTGETETQGIVGGKLSDPKVNKEKREEIPLKEFANESAKGKTEVAKDGGEVKEGKIDPSSKTRKSTKSPLLEKLLSPGRRSKRGQKDKTKSPEVERAGHSEDVAEANTSKDDDKSAKIQAEKLSDSSKVTKVEAKVEETTKSKGKSDDGQKKLEQTEKVKCDAKTSGSHENEPLSTITGAFNLKFGGKKSK
ncbi:uncharacterized protein LOC114534531 [Dendronephthya gigantea]|uniref:uncharacterized protein LOC114534531 n=1 Tax=Dendronephthya gigantea TaxID=151771 RepID=UPI001069AA2A|nr:uncharacterized protein LOC114534531 [Dendronephthya gigantea]